MICSTPAIITASKNVSNDPSLPICAATMAVKPAAGPLTLVCEPLRTPTKMPPMIPATMPEKSGALDASATPRQSGSATRKTTRSAERFLKKVADEVGEVAGMQGD